jgi:hypothetical protein
VIHFLTVFLPTLVGIYLFPSACCMPRPSYPPCFDHQFSLGVQIMKLHSVQFSPAFCYFLRLRFKYSSHYPNTPSVFVLPLFERSQISLQYKTGNVISCCHVFIYRPLLIALRVRILIRRQFN